MGEGGCSGVVLGVDANHSGIRAWEDLHSERVCCSVARCMASALYANGMGERVALPKVQPQYGLRMTGLRHRTDPDGLNGLNDRLIT